MKSFFEKEEFTEKDILSLIDNEIEESIHLDFKDARSLGKSDGKKKELSKDVAAFANSDGGIIIYGLQEKDHKAHSISFIDGNEYSKEWIEQLINTTIQRHIPDLRIYPIRFNSLIENTVYVVKIPKSTETPHMSRDKRFYKRFNFESVFMEEYEVRELYGRKLKSLLIIGDYRVSLLNRSNDDFDDDFFKFQFEASIINDGDIPESDYKLNLYFNNFTKEMSITWNRNMTNYDPTKYSNNRIKLSTTKSPTIYSNEKMDLIKVMVSIKIGHALELLKDLNFELKLLYLNGEDAMEGNFKNLEENVILQTT